MPPIRTFRRTGRRHRIHRDATIAALGRRPDQLVVQRHGVQRRIDPAQDDIAAFVLVDFDGDTRDAPQHFRRIAVRELARCVRRNRLHDISGIAFFLQRPRLAFPRALHDVLPHQGDIRDQGDVERRTIRISNLDRLRRRAIAQTADGERIVARSDMGENELATGAAVSGTPRLAQLNRRAQQKGIGILIANVAGDRAGNRVHRSCDDEQKCQAD